MPCIREVNIETIEDNYDIQDLRENSCSICTIPFAIGDSITRMPCCSKPLDPHCLAEWAKTSVSNSSDMATCPYCRSAFNPHSITYLFPESTPKTLKFHSEDKTPEPQNRQLKAHHRQVFDEIAKANEHDKANFSEAIQKLSSHTWPPVSPARLQHLQQHFLRFGKLNETLSTDADRESPDVEFNNVLIVPAPGHGDNGSILSNGIVLRLDYTSVYQERESANGFRDQIYVYADPRSTVKDLAKAWLKVWVRGSVEPSHVMAWVDQVNFSKIPYLFYQRLDRDRWMHLQWEDTLGFASTMHSGQISIMEEECIESHMNPAWQQVWHMIQNGHMNSKRLRELLNQLRVLKERYEAGKSLLEDLHRQGCVTGLNRRDRDLYFQLLIMNWEKSYQNLQESRMDLRTELFGRNFDDDASFVSDFDALQDNLHTIDAEYEQIRRGFQA